ncbi:MAG: nucleoside triphosphate pyrophosphohydrolase [Anaerovoracaceae bacterium]|jgi:tetrapyrrole methylase family protein/MazG family protein
MEDALAELYKEAETAGKAVERLKKIIEILRSDEGCPWDREQTHSSIRWCLVEEAYEVNEAIENHDWDNLEEELGDVLLQVVFHGEMGQEKDRFDLRSIANRECEKMIRRHPHVFEIKGTKGGNPTFYSEKSDESIDRALERWENVKRKERRGTETDSMEGIPKALPALLRSYKLQEKAANVGFDWDNIEDVFRKIREEHGEFLEAYSTNNIDKIQEELGDLLFAVVNAARFLNINPEDALNSTSRKFIERFGFIEKEAIKEGRSITDMTLTEMDVLWEKAKMIKGKG